MQPEVKVQIETINHLNEYIELLKQRKCCPASDESQKLLQKCMVKSMVVLADGINKFQQEVINTLQVLSQKVSTIEEILLYQKIRRMK